MEQDCCGNSRAPQPHRPFCPAPQQLRIYNQ
jgi:hypothetical protein